MEIGRGVPTSFHFEAQGANPIALARGRFFMGAVGRLGDGRPTWVAVAEVTGA